MSTASTLEILVDIRSHLTELERTQREVRKLADDTRKAGEEANKLGAAFRTGFGVDVVRRGVDLLTNSLRQNVFAAFSMAEQLKDVSQNLQIDTESLQVLSQLVKENGGEFQNLTQAVVNYRNVLAQAREGNGAAAETFRNLRLSADELARLPIERQLEMVAKRIDEAGEGTDSFDAAVSLLGRRNAPQLTAALRTLAREGYDEVAKAAKEAGQVMENDSIERLDRAKESIERFQRSVTIQVGETIGALDMIGESLGKDTGGTLRGILGAFMGDYTALGMSLAKNVTPATSNAGIPDAPVLSTEDERRRFRLFDLERQMGDVVNNSLTTESARRRQIVDLLEQQADLLNEKLRDYPETIKVNENTTQAELALLKEKTEIEAQLNQLFLQRRAILSDNAFDASRRNFENATDPANPNSLTMGQGVAVGAMDFVSGLGSKGEQVASLVTDSLGNAVSGISDGIYGWVTGTGDFGDALLDIGDTILKQLLDTIVQMGVQWVVTGGLAKATMTGISALGSILRKKEAAETLATEATKTPLLMTNAAAASASSFGLSAVIGLALLMALMAAFGGFADGGYTGPGGKNELAGAVHKGEVVFSQADVSRFGGVEAVEQMRTSRVSSPGSSSPILANGGGGSGMVGGRPQRLIVVDERNKDLIDQLMSDPAYENRLQRMISGNPGAFGIPA